jgi:hypothetical protein
MASHPDPRRWKVRIGAACIPLAFLAWLGCEMQSEGMEPGEMQEGPWWELSSSALLSIGGAGAEGPAALHQVGAGMLLSDGQIVIALRDEILLFSESGTFNEFLGRAGEGPGEYRGIASIGRLSGSDRFRVFDWGNQRISTARDGGTLDTELLGLNAILLGGNAVAQPDGSVVGSRWKLMLDRISGARDPIRPGPRFDSLVLFRFAGAKLDTISIRESGLLITSRTGHWTFTSTPPLGRKLLTGIGPEIVAQGFNDTGEFLLLGLDGAELGVAEVRAKKREVTDSIWSAAGQEFLRGLGAFPLPGQSREALLKAVLKGAPEPEFLPLVDQVFFDLEQNLWLRRFCAGESPEAVWEIHSREGQFLALIRMPSNLELLEIGRDYLLGVQKDSLDIETVVKFGLVRGE